MPARRRSSEYRNSPVYVRPGASRRRRRSRTAGRIRLVALLALVAAVVVLVVEATSSGSQSRPAVARHAANEQQGASSPSGGRSRQSRTTGTASTHTDPLEASAVRQVLAYTPFITGGVPKHRVIALTFDDGPSPYTAQIVSELARLHVPATFFVVGQQLNDFSAGLRDEMKHGFAIGDHTENHAQMTHLSPAGQYKQIHDDAVRIERLGAPAPLLYRPPYGVYNSATLTILKRLGMLMTLWAVDTRDWERPGTTAIIHGAVSAARPGAIVLMHDGGGDRSQTVAALPAIVKALKRRHYGFVTVPQLLRLDPPPRGQRLPHVAE